MGRTIGRPVPCRSGGPSGGLRWRAPCRLPLFFFFPAEDGIRAATVTGVQTCALPICLPRSDAGFEPRHDFEETRVTIMLARIPAQRTPDLCRVGVIESRRHHADNGETATVKRDRLAENIRVGVVTAPPQLVSDDRPALAPRTIFAWLKSAPDDRPRAQHVEEPVGHVNRADALRLAARIGKVDLRIPPARDLVEEMLLLTPIAVGDGRCLALLQAAGQSPSRPRASSS